jgi:hypothetical protein
LGAKFIPGLFRFYFGFISFLTHLKMQSIVTNQNMMVMSLRFVLTHMMATIKLTKFQ